jgi:hypothetical protein
MDFHIFNALNYKKIGVELTMKRNSFLKVAFVVMKIGIYLTAVFK